MLALTRRYGFVVAGELAFDSARRDELGAGQTVFQGTAVYVKFFEGGEIFAPTLAHSVGLGDTGDRKRVGLTTLDMYYVPRLADRRYFMTYDPAITQDWANDQTFASLSITFGRNLGPAFRAKNSNVFIRPQAFFGGERGADWSLQVGYRVIGL